MRAPGAASPTVRTAQCPRGTRLHSQLHRTRHTAPLVGKGMCRASVRACKHRKKGCQGLSLVTQRAVRLGKDHAKA